MNPADDLGRSDSGRRTQYPSEQRAPAMGSPLPVGQFRQPFASPPEERQHLSAASGPGRSTPSAQDLASANPDAFSLQRILSQAMPFVHKMLPLIDGNIAAALGNLLAPRPPAPPPAPVVNLEPIEDNLIALKAQQRDLRNQIAEQNSALKRVEDQLEMVREATDRNTLEQQELMEDLKAVGNKVNLIAVVALLLLAVSIALNVLLYLHISRVLP